MGRCVGITVSKGWSRVGARTDTLKNPTKCLWRWEPDRRSYFFFSPPAHLCAVTYMAEISLLVTLNNQFTSPHINHFRVISLDHLHQHPYHHILYSLTSSIIYIITICSIHYFHTSSEIALQLRILFLWAVLPVGRFHIM